jgi:hypothetical protein
VERPGMCALARTSARANARRSSTRSMRTAVIDRNGVCPGDGPRRGCHHGPAGTRCQPNRQTAVSAPWLKPLQI